MRQSYFFHDPSLFGMPHYSHPRPPRRPSVARYIFLAVLLGTVVLIASVRAQGWKGRTAPHGPAVSAPGSVPYRHPAPARPISLPQT